MNLLNNDEQKMISRVHVQEALGRIKDWVRSTEAKIGKSASAHNYFTGGNSLTMTLSDLEIIYGYHKGLEAHERVAEQIRQVINDLRIAGPKWERERKLSSGTDSTHVGFAERDMQTVLRKIEDIYV